MSDVIRVSVGIIRDENRFILAKRDETSKLAGRWELPGGAIPDGVSNEESLKNHLAKSYNLDVVIGDKLGTSSHDYDFGKVEVTAYFVECISTKIRLSKHLAYRWIRFNMLKDFDVVESALPLIDTLKQQAN